MTLRIRSLAACLAGLAVGTPVLAQTTISAPGGSTIGSFGPAATPTYGQTFTVPDTGDTRLDSFSFFLLNAAPSMSFRGYVFSWDSGLGRAAGDALFTSAIFAGPAENGSTRYDVATGGLALMSNSVYVAFLSTSGLDGVGQTSWASAGSNPYAGGAFVFLNGGQVAAQWTNESWTTNWEGAGSDLQLEMAFNPALDPSVVPEPISVALLGSGHVAMGGIGAMRRRRQRSTV